MNRNDDIPAGFFLASGKFSSSVYVSILECYNHQRTRSPSKMLNAIMRSFLVSPYKSYSSHYGQHRACSPLALTVLTSKHGAKRYPILIRNARPFPKNGRTFSGSLAIKIRFLAQYFPPFEEHNHGNRK